MQKSVSVYGWALEFLIVCLNNATIRAQNSNTEEPLGNWG